MTIIPDHKYFMARAIHLAKKGLYTTDPNPRVGCVLVRNGEIVGEGWHARAGCDHAEINALSMAADSARGATAYITLEPCSHYGKTPPCYEALINHGVSHVVTAMEDPNPLVAGRGHKYLREAGLSVRTGVLKQEAAGLNPGFIKRMRIGIPWVRVKLAASIDGRTAMASGESTWITGAAARKDVQYLRARSSCILTGSGTVRFDNPSLNVRLSAEELDIQGSVRQPVRVVLDSQLQLSREARIYQLDGETITYTCQEINNIKFNKNNCINNIFNVNTNLIKGNKINLANMLDDLAKREINEVHVEAGATLCGALLSQNLVDEIVLYTAPSILGDSGRALFHLPLLQRMRDRIQLRFTDLTQVDQDIKLTLSVDNPT